MSDMSEMPAPPQMLDVSAPIEIDLACRRCGYNLRGLALASLCPECGSPVELSSHGNLIQYASPPWLARITLGVRLRFWGILLMFFMIVPVMLIIFLRLPRSITPWLFGLATLVSIAGEWLFTSPDPAEPPSDHLLTPRRVARGGAMLAAARTIVDLITGALPQPSLLWWALLFFTLIAGLLVIVGDLAQFTYLAQLAERVPSDRIARFARQLRIPFAVVMTLALLWGSFARKLMFFIPYTAFALIVLFGLALYGGALVIAILELVLLARVQKALARQLPFARQHWETGPAAAPTQPPPPALLSRPPPPS